ncbi:hypothetical protein SCLCIDRAFT_982374 [Scleroderma citrinum Foug A]|uniref:Uncharacterized protein n=1 Tax=Scleroderma citrinum Foug A TaxID=1036808 RepID=A0A0C3DUE6_9AGAM|nr:hypothetical protein SCLCIDRAFT_982374 [Scleroderma citrinum Foug A]
MQRVQASATKHYNRFQWPTGVCHPPERCVEPYYMFVSLTLSLQGRSILWSEETRC